MVREQLERNVPNPSEEDIRKIRHDVLEIITRAGADPKTVDITVEVDSQKNILRATATGATELRTKDRAVTEISEQERLKIAAEGARTDENKISLLAATGKWHVYEAAVTGKSFFGLVKHTSKTLSVMDSEGVIRLKKNKAKILVFRKSDLHTDFVTFLDSMTSYTDAGETLPRTYLFFSQKMSDLSGVQTKEQLLHLAEIELEFTENDEDIIAVAAKD